MKSTGAQLRTLHGQLMLCDIGPKFRLGMAESKFGAPGNLAVTLRDPYINDAFVIERDGSLHAPLTGPQAIPGQTSFLPDTP